MGKILKGELTREEALGKAAALCSGSEHCVSQVEEKLAAWGVSGSDAEEIVARLVDEKFIDNMRFARAYCHDRFLYSHWGRIKIRQMLRHLRLSDEDIEAGMAVISDEGYQEALAEAIESKDRTLRDTDPYQRKAKLVRHLLSRGFEMDLALSAVSRYLSKKSLQDFDD